MGEVAFESYPTIAGCCALGGEVLGEERLIPCRVRDIRRRGPFFAYLGKQPDLNRGGGRTCSLGSSVRRRALGRPFETT
jgi:hypothetical protein